jgi:hypothetical protein
VLALSAFDVRASALDAKTFYEHMVPRVPLTPATITAAASKTRCPRVPPPKADAGHFHVTDLTFRAAVAIPWKRVLTAIIGVAQDSK